MLVDLVEVPPGYFQLTRSATYCFLAALPLLVAYELLIILANRTRVQQVRVGADVWTKQILEAAGVTTHATLATTALAVGVIAILCDSHRRVELRPYYFAGMFLESILYAIGMAYVVFKLVYSVLPAVLPSVAIGAGDGFILSLALSLGAGLYEELFFRVLLFGGIAALLRLFLKKRRALVVAAIVSSLIFSGIHYIGEFAYVLELQSFLFRFLLGIVLTGIYYARGFAVAAWSHALYDVLVIFVNHNAN